MNEIVASAAAASPIPTESAPHPLDIQLWYRRVYAQCRSRLICESDCEDAVQETFVRALSRLGELRSDDAIGAWLRQIARNVCVDMIRRQRVRRAASIDIDSVSNPHEHDSVVDREQIRCIMQRIHQLPKPQREIILLHYYENMTYDEMATWLGIARSTVNERLSKARQHLKSELKSLGDCP